MKRSLARYFRFSLRTLLLATACAAVGTLTVQQYLWIPSREAHMESTLAKFSPQVQVFTGARDPDRPFLLASENRGFHEYPFYWRITKKHPVCAIQCRDTDLAELPARIFSCFPNLQAVSIVHTPQTWRVRAQTPDQRSELAGSLARDQFIDLVARSGVVSLALEGIDLTAPEIELIGRNRTIRHLQLMNCAIADEDLVLLSGMTQLETLSLANHDRYVHAPNTASGASFASILRNLRSMEFLNVSGCPFGDESVRTIGQCKSLTYLNVSKTRVTNKGLLSIAQSTSIEELHCADVLILNDGLDALMKMPCIKTIWMPGSSLRPSDLEGYSIQRPAKLVPHLFYSGRTPRHAKE